MASRTTGPVMLAPRASDVLALGGLAGIRHLVASEGGASAQAVAHALGIGLSSWNPEGDRRSVISGSDVVGLAGAPEILPGSCVLAYANDARLDRCLAARGARMLGPSSSLYESLADKAAMREVFKRHGLPVPDGFVPQGAFRFADVARRLGVPFVAQARRGSMGRSTWLVHDAACLQATMATSDAEGWLMSRWLPGPTLNLHGTVQADGVVVSRPSLQLTGPPALTDERFAYCGADFGAAAAVKPELTVEVQTITGRVGNVLGDLGWTGIFGVDVQLSTQGPRLLEVNPRLQASSGLLAEIEAAVGEVPIGQRHIAVVTGARCHVAPADGGAGLTPDAGFMVLRHRRPGGVVRRSPKPGVYALDGDRLVFRRAGVGLRACQPGECWIEGFAALPNTWHEPGAAMARLTAPTRLAESDGRTLTADGSALATGLRQLLGVGEQDASYRPDVA